MAKEFFTVDENSASFIIISKYAFIAALYAALSSYLVIAILDVEYAFSHNSKDFAYFDAFFNPYKISFFPEKFTLFTEMSTLPPIMYSRIKRTISKY